MRNALSRICHNRAPFGRSIRLLRAASAVFPIGDTLGGLASSLNAPRRLGHA
jgi:hypothetical protein